MPGKFCGLTDPERDIIVPLLSPVPLKKGKGRPRAPFRDIVSTVIRVFITGAGWADIPAEKGSGKRSASRRWLGGYGNQTGHGCGSKPVLWAKPVILI